MKTSLLILSLCMLCCGCAGTTYHQLTYLTLKERNVDKNKGAINFPGHISVAVRPVVIAPQYDEDAILVRTGSARLERQEKARWRESLGSMMSSVIEQNLLDVDTGKKLTIVAGDASADYTINATLLQMDVYGACEDEPETATVSLAVTITRGDPLGRAPLTASFTYLSDKVTVADKSPHNVPAALSNAISTVADKIAHDLDTFSRRPDHVVQVDGTLGSGSSSRYTIALRVNRMAKNGVIILTNVFGDGDTIKIPKLTRSTSDGVLSFDGGAIEISERPLDKGKTEYHLTVTGKNPRAFTIDKGAYEQLVAWRRGI